MPVTSVSALEEIHESVGQLRCALLAVHDLAKDIQDYDNAQFRIGILIGMLGEQADHIYGQLHEHIYDVTHPKEAPHV